MVPVEMGQEDDRVEGTGGLDQVNPEGPDARTCVQDEPVAPSLDLEARRVATVSCGCRTRARDRSPRAPETEGQRGGGPSVGATATAFRASGKVAPGERYAQPF